MQKSSENRRPSGAKRVRTDAQTEFWKRVLFTAAPLLVLLIFYARWLLTARPQSLLGILLSACAVFLFALLGVRFIPQWMGAWSDAPWLPERQYEGKRSSRARRMHPIFSIVLILIAFRLALFVLAYLMLLSEGGYTGGIFDNLGVWNMVGSDSRHYLNIAENWYVSSGDDRLLIVFLPFYPVLIRLVNYIFHNYLVSGLFLSNLCCVDSGVLLYELALLDYDVAASRRALKYLCLFPAAFLLSAPLSDALFLTLSLACMLLMRKRHYALASIMGFFAAFTRSPGLLLFAPLCFELVGDIIRERKARRGDAKWLLHSMGSALSLLLVPAGFLLYLYVNYTVTGNPLICMTYQSAHWHQQLGWFFSTVNTQAENLVQNLLPEGNYKLALGLWLPNLLAIFASLGLVTGAQNKLRTSYVAYFIAYFSVCAGATWLLSGPRYLAACFPVALSMGVLTEQKWADRLMTLVCIALTVLYLAAYVHQWYVY